MTFVNKPNLLKLSALCAGIACLFFRANYLATGVDSRGLLVAGHWANISSWLLTAAVILGIFIAVRTVCTIAWILMSLQTCNAPEQYRIIFPASFLQAAGYLLAACGLLLSDISAVPTGRLAQAEPVLRILAAAAMIIVAYCRLRGKKPLFLFHGTVCLYLALRMICLYQIWSADPQLQHYAFYLGAHVALMLLSYQLAAFDAHCGNHRTLWGWGLAGIYLCLAAIPGSQEPFFLLYNAVWCLTCLCKLTQKKSAPTGEEA